MKIRWKLIYYTFPEQCLHIDLHKDISLTAYDDSAWISFEATSTQDLSKPRQAFKQINVYKQIMSKLKILQTELYSTPAWKNLKSAEEELHNFHKQNNQ